MTTVGVARQCVERHGEHQTCWCHIQRLAKLLHSVVVERKNHLRNMAVRLAGREIVSQFRTTLTLLHHFGEIGLGMLIGFVALSLTLFQ